MKRQRAGTGIFNYKKVCHVCGQKKKVDINAECRDCYNKMKRFRGVNVFEW